LAAGLGGDARRKARRVASHTSDLQRSSAPKSGESNVQIIDEQALSPVVSSILLGFVLQQHHHRSIQ
jgi:hypothetical protein